MKINRNSNIYSMAEYVVRLEKALHLANTMLNQNGKLGVLPTETSVYFRDANTFHKNVRTVLDKYKLLDELTIKQEKTKKCIISRYDKTIIKPPYLTIKLDSFEISMPENDNGGEEFAHKLIAACQAKGYSFRFYTSSNEKNIDFEVVVD